MLGKNDTASTTYKAKYLGGHSAFPNAKAVHLVLTSKHIEIPEMSLMIPLNQVENAQLVKEEKFATSLITLPWKKKENKKFIMLTFEDENNFEESMVFDVDKAEEAHTAIISAKTLATSGNR
jgi:hypothetical protein